MLDAGPLPRPHHPARAARSSCGCVAERSTRPGAQARQGALPRVRGRGRRPRHGGGDRGQRQGAAGRACATRWRRCSCTRAVARPLPARWWPRASREAGRGAARLTRGPRALVPERAAGRAGGLGHGVPRPHPGRAGGGRASTRRSRTSAGTARGWPRPSSPATCGARGASRARWTRRAVLVNASTRLVDGSQFGHGRRDGHLHLHASTRAARWGCASSPPRSSWCGATGRSGSSRLRRASASSAGRSTRSTSATCCWPTRSARRSASTASCFVPAAQPPHKPAAELAPAVHRFAMGALAVARAPALRGLRRRAASGAGPSYTVDTLSALPDRATAVPRHRVRDVPRPARAGASRGASRRSRAWW